MRALDSLMHFNESEMYIVCKPPRIDNKQPAKDNEYKYLPYAGKSRYAIFVLLTLPNQLDKQLVYRSSDHLFIMHGGYR